MHAQNAIACHLCLANIARFSFIGPFWRIQSGSLQSDHYNLKRLFFWSSSLILFRISFLWTHYYFNASITSIYTTLLRSYIWYFKISFQKCHFYSKSHHIVWTGTSVRPISLFSYRPIPITTDISDFQIGRYRLWYRYRNCHIGWYRCRYRYIVNFIKSNFMEKNEFFCLFL